MLYSLPNKYYLKDKSLSYQSTTVGNFSPEAALKGESGFKGRMLPSTRAENRAKKTLILNYFPDHIHFYRVVAHLLNEGFQVHARYKDIVVNITREAIEATGILVYGNPHEYLIDWLVSYRKTTKEPLRADHILICEYQEMIELRSCIIPDEPDYNDQTVFQDWLIEYWQVKKTLPQGKGYPNLVVNDELLDAFKEEGIETLSKAGFKLTYDLNDQTLPSKPAYCIEDITVSKEIVLKYAPIRQDDIDSIKIRSQTLKSLKLKENWINYSILCQLLALCPALESLSVDRIKPGFIKDKDFNPIQAWKKIDLSNLKALHVESDSKYSHEFVNDCIENSPNLEIFSQIVEQDHGLESFEKLQDRPLKFFSYKGPLTPENQHKLYILLSQAKELRYLSIESGDFSLDRFMQSYNPNFPRLETFKHHGYKIYSSDIIKLRFVSPNLNSIDITSKQFGIKTYQEQPDENIEGKAKVLDLKLHLESDSVHQLINALDPTIRLSANYNQHMQTIPLNFSGYCRFLQLQNIDREYGYKLKTLKGVLVNSESCQLLTELILNNCLIDLGHDEITALRTDFLTRLELKDTLISKINLITLVLKSPYLKYLVLPKSDEHTLRKLINLLQNSHHLHKVLLIESIRQSLKILNAETRSHSILASTPIIQQRGQKDDNQVYGARNGSPNISNLNPRDEVQHYELEPLFVHVSGQKIELKGIRKEAFKPKYDHINKVIERVVIEPKLRPYSLPSNQNETLSVYKRHPHTVTINQPTHEIPKPWVKLIGLKSHDILLSVNIINLTLNNDYEIKYSNTDGFYYLCFNTLAPLSRITLSYELSPQVIPIKTYPERLRSLLEPFKRNYEGNPDESFTELSLEDQLESINTNPEFHACQERTYAFLSKAPKLVVQNIIEDYRAGASPSHVWAELKINDEWIMLDLGGAPASLTYLPSTSTHTATMNTEYVQHFTQNTIFQRFRGALNWVWNKLKIPTFNIRNPFRRQHLAQIIPQAQPQVEAETETQFTPVPAAPKPKDYNIDTADKLNELLNTEKINQNILLVCENDHQISLMRDYFLSHEPERTTIIDNPADISSTSKYLSVNLDESTWSIQDPQGTGGWIKNRLSQTGDKVQKRLVFNWERFSSSQAVGINSAIEAQDRSLDGVPLAPSLLTLGLITSSHPLMKDSSFKRRYVTQIWTLKLNLEKITETYDDEPATTINLYHSPAWKQILLGALTFIKGESKISQIPLQELQTRNLIIKNPPVESIDFEHCLSDLRQGFEIKFYDRSLRFPKFNITLAPSEELTIDVSMIESVLTNITDKQLKTIAIDHVLTPSTFERALVSNTITQEGHLITGPGWLDQGARSFFITATLSEQQYAYLFEHAKYPLRLYLAPGVKHPNFKDLEMNTNHPESAVISDKSKFELGPETLILDVSELSPDDIFYRYDYSLNQDNQFIFKETVSEAWQALLSGQHLCLKGYFSPELVDHLATLMLPQGYLWHRGEKVFFKGRLNLMPSHEIKAFNWCKDKLLPYVDSRVGLKGPTLNVETSEERVPALLSMIKSVRSVFIEGEPGVGKSYFIRTLLKRKDLLCFTLNTQDLNGLEAFGKSKDPRNTLLLVDEATLRGTEWSFLNGNRFLVNGRLYEFSQNKKVIFLGNRIEPMPALFNDKFPTLKFKKLSTTEIIENILKPIFKTIGQESQAQAFYQQHHEQNSLRSLHDLAIAHCAQLTRAGTAMKISSERYIVTESRRGVFNNLLSILQIREFKRSVSVDLDLVRFGGTPGCWLEGPPGAGKTEIIRLALSCAGYQIKEVDNLYTDLPADQTKTAYQLRASCNIQSARRHLAYAHKYGLTLWIDELDVLLDSDSASPEELNQFIAELNSYLMGENLNCERPPYPGFTLLATGNGIGMEGRALLHESILSRLHSHSIQVYPKLEIIQILFENLRSTETHYESSSERGLLINQKIDEYHKDPKAYPFSTMLSDLKSILYTKSNSSILKM